MSKNVNITPIFRSHDLPYHIRIKDTLIEIVINFFLWTLAIIFCSIPLLLGVIVRFSVHIIVKLLRPDLMAASSNDCAMVRGTPDKMPVTNGGLILRIDGNINCDEFKVYFKQLFLYDKTDLHYRNFFCELKSFAGFMHKKVIETAINIDHHIKEVQFNSKVDKCVKELVTSWFQKRFQNDYPLWEILLLKCEENNETVLCLKMSHALADGYSLVHILDKMTGNKSPDYTNSSAGKFSICEKVKMFATLPHTCFKFLMRDLWTPDCFPTLKTLNRIEMMHLSWATVDLKPLKQVRQKLKVHFPCIIYSLQVGAIRKLLLEKMSQEELSEYTYLSSSLPVAGHPRNALINHWTGGRFKIPLKSPDPLQRLLLTNKAFEDVTKDEAPYLMWKYVTPLFWLLPSPVAFLLSFINLGIFRYRSTISCIPQATEKYFLLGHVVKHVYHAPMLKDSFPRAVMLGCSSTQNKQIDLTLFGHPELVPTQEDMDRVMNVYFKEELQNLLTSAEITENLNWRQ